MNMKKLVYIIKEIILSFLLIMPNSSDFCKLRGKYYRFLGCKVGKGVSIAANVRITGKFEIGNYSSIAQNCTFSGRHCGICIGNNVMIAPNVVCVAFDHISKNLNIPLW